MTKYTTGRRNVMADTPTPQKLTVLERVKRKPLISAILAIATVLGAITAIITGIEKINGFMDNNIVSPSDLIAVKKEIVNEFRSESAEIRTIYIMDIQERIESLEDELEVTENTGKQLVLTSKIKELRNRINKLSEMEHHNE